MLLVVLWVLWPSPPQPPLQAIMPSLVNAIDCDGFATTTSTEQHRFPYDHGAHDNSCSEVWSFSGQLTSPEQQLFGFHLAFFRLAIARQQESSQSAWVSNQIYRAVLTITDSDQARFHSAELINREALGIAGSERSPTRIWLTEWQFSVTAGNRFILVADNAEFSLTLTLTATKPPRSDINSSGNTTASYFISRLAADGQLTFQDQSHTVTGLAWFNHAWGNLPLAGGQLVVNRYQLQLSDQRELLLFELRRRRDSERPAITTGLLIDQTGTITALSRDQIKLTTTAYWHSADGVRYASGWTLDIPDEQLSLTLNPVFADQELKHSLRSWSGSLAIKNRRGDRFGYGFTELTGFAAEH